MWKESNTHEIADDLRLPLPLLLLPLLLPALLHPSPPGTLLLFFLLALAHLAGLLGGKRMRLGDLCGIRLAVGQDAGVGRSDVNLVDKVES